MKKYENSSRNSGVQAYEEGPGFICVRFVGGTVYRYSYNKAGETHVKQMKRHAETGKGLATYISKYVKDLYD